jgi:FkbM family methyltransferase
MLKSTLRTLRDLPIINRPLSTAIKALVRDRPPEFVVRHLPRHGTVEIEVSDGKKVRFWSKGDDWITSRLWWLGLDGHEPEMNRPFQEFAKHARTILDIGAYTGFYALLAVAVNPTARVFAFEPHPGIAARLGRNVSLNQANSVTILPYVVASERSGLVEFHIGGPGLPSSSSRAEDWRGLHQSIWVAAIDIDSFCLEWGLEHVDLIKMDVEAMEPDVVRGMNRVLDANRPVVFSEVHPGGDDRYTSMYIDLQRRGYDAFRLVADRCIRSVNLDFRSQDGTAVNYLFCPQEKIPSWLVISDD